MTIRVVGHTLDELDQLTADLTDLITAAIGTVISRVTLTLSTQHVLHAAADDIIPEQWSLLVGDMSHHVTGVYESSALSIATQLADECHIGGNACVPYVSDDFAKVHMQEATNRLVGIGDEVWGDVRASLAEGLSAGEDIEQLANRVQQAAGVSERRAYTIARTEVTKASNAGALAQIRFVGLDEEGKKEWIATEDLRTRMWHLEADGQLRHINEPFLVGGEEIQHPGEGSASNVVNCRCTVVFLFDDDVEPTTAIEAELFAAAPVSLAPGGNCVYPPGTSAPPATPGAISLPYTAKLAVYQSWQLEPGKISPAYGGAAIYKRLEALRKELSMSGDPDLMNLDHWQLLKILDELEPTKGTHTYTSKFTEWYNTSAGKKAAKGVKLNVPNAPQPTPAPFTAPSASHVLPPVSPKPNPGEIQFTGKTLGSHGAQVWVNPTTGERWLFKPQADFLTQLDKTMGELQSKALQTRPGVYEITLDGKKGSIQYMFDSKEAFPAGTFDPATLSAADIAVLQKEQIFDWLISNFDTHSGQFIRLTDGTLYGTDKGQAFKFFGKDKLDWDYVPVTPLGGDRLTYSAMWKRFVQGKDIDLLDPTQGELGEFLDRLMAIPDSTYRTLLRPFAEASHKQGIIKDVDAFLDAAVARKQALRTDFEDFWQRAQAERAKHLPVPKAPAPAPAPAPPAAAKVVATPDVWAELPNYQVGDVIGEGFSQYGGVPIRAIKTTNGVTTELKMNGKWTAANVSELNESDFKFLNQDVHNWTMSPPTVKSVLLDTDHMWPELDKFSIGDVIGESNLPDGTKIRLVKTQTGGEVQVQSVADGSWKHDFNVGSANDIHDEYPAGIQWKMHEPPPVAATLTDDELYAEFETHLPTGTIDAQGVWQTVQDLRKKVPGMSDAEIVKRLDVVAHKLYGGTPGYYTHVLGPYLNQGGGMFVVTGQAALSAAQKQQIYQAFIGVQKVTPAYNGSKIYGVLQDAKKTLTGPPFDGLSDTDFLRVLDEVHGSPAGKTFEAKVRTYAQTAAGKKTTGGLASLDASPTATATTPPVVVTPTLPPSTLPVPIHVDDIFNDAKYTQLGGDLATHTAPDGMVVTLKASPGGKVDVHYKYADGSTLTDGPFTKAAFKKEFAGNWQWQLPAPKTVPTPAAPSFAPLGSTNSTSTADVYQGMTNGTPVTPADIHAALATAPDFTYVAAYPTPVMNGSFFVLVKTKNGAVQLSHYSTVGNQWTLLKHDLKGKDLDYVLKSSTKWKMAPTATTPPLTPTVPGKVAKKVAAKAAKKAPVIKPPKPVHPADDFVKNQPIDISMYSDADAKSAYDLFKSSVWSPTSLHGKYLSGKPKDIWVHLQHTREELIKQGGVWADLTDRQLIRLIDEQSAKKFKIPNQHKFEEKLVVWASTPTGKKFIKDNALGITKTVATKTAKAAPLKKTGYNPYSAPPATPKPPRKPYVQPPYDAKVLAHKVPPNPKPASVVSDTEMTTLWQQMQADQGVLSTAEKAAVKSWSGSSGPFNRYLREGVGDKETASRTLQHAMRRVTRSIVVHRGTNMDEFSDIGITHHSSLADLQAKLPNGAVVEMKGFSATSVGGNAAFSGSVRMEYEIPTGAPITWVKPYSNYAGENEILLPAGARFEIISVSSCPGGYPKVCVKLRMIVP